MEVVEAASEEAEEDHLEVEAVDSVEEAVDSAEAVVETAVAEDLAEAVVETAVAEEAEVDEAVWAEEVPEEVSEPVPKSQSFHTIDLRVFTFWEENRKQFARRI